jgi:branched-chain amino acid transport system substrate-binding protein
MFAAAVLAAAALTGCGEDKGSGGAVGGASTGGGDGEPIKVGAPLALTGPAATFGQTQRVTLEALVERANQQGGINGRTIELIVKDTKTDPTEAARVGAELIRQEKVMAIIGETTSGGTLGFLPDAGRQGVAVLTLGADPELVDPDADYFPTTFQIPHQISADNEVIQQRLTEQGHRRVAIIHQEDALHVTGAKDFIETVEEAGLEVVENTSVAGDATDVAPQVLSVLNADPDAVYLLMSSAELAASTLRALERRGFAGATVGSAGTVQSSLTESAGEAANGFFAPALVNPDDSSARPKLQELMEPLGGIENHGNFTAAQAFAVLEAGLNAGPESGEELASALEQAGTIEGYNAPIEYADNDHLGIGPEGLIPVEVRDGKFVTVPE